MKPLRPLSNNFPAMVLFMMLVSFSFVSDCHLCNRFNSFPPRKLTIESSNSSSKTVDEKLLFFFKENTQRIETASYSFVSYVLFPTIALRA